MTPRRIRHLAALATIGMLSASFGAAQTVGRPAVVASESIFDVAPFASAHASTIVETKTGLVAAWFGGSREAAPDVGIWLSRRVGSAWTPPREVATGVEADGQRYPCWNPVLFEASDSSLMLFYKVGPQVAAWWGMVRVSRDGGQTWGDARRLPDGVIGPVKNKPIRLARGDILAGSSTESFDARSKWRVKFERTADNGRTWTSVAPAPAPSGVEIDAIQPSILTYADGSLQGVGRSRSGRVFETWSRDDGKTWSALALTNLPNPNSGLDAVTLRDGRQLIVYNHTSSGRTPLNVSLSRDGRAWSAALVLENEPGEYSYPAVIQSSDGVVHVTYTWNRRRIKHVALDPARLPSTPIRDGAWPP